jgi:hypothetical protein
MKTQQVDKTQNSGDSNSIPWRERWISQHTRLERYILGLYVTFSVMRRFQIDPRSWRGRLLIVLFTICVYLGLPFLLTASTHQLASAPLILWGIIASIFGITFLSYGIYSSIGNDVCAISHSVQNDKSLQQQIEWDSTWFNIRVAGTVGLITATSVLLSIARSSIYSQRQFIPSGTLIVIGLLSYQIGEIACNNLLICFEARNFSRMDHRLYRFSPLDTFSLQKAIRGYNRFGLTTSLLMTVYIAASALLLPMEMYLHNFIWLGLVLLVYLIIICGVVVPRIYIQEIVRNYKEKELVPIRKHLNALFDRLSMLSPQDFSEMSRLVELQQQLQRAPESCLPLSTVGRLFGTLLLPTFTFVLAVAGEAYLTKLIERVLR